MSRCHRSHCGGTVIADQTGASRCSLCGRGVERPVAVPVQHCVRCDSTFSHVRSKLCTKCRTHRNHRWAV